MEKETFNYPLTHYYRIVNDQWNKTAVLDKEADIKRNQN
jgi:hypothetical protein